jgi:hypothetical protein
VVGGWWLVVGEHWLNFELYHNFWWFGSVNISQNY